MGLDAGIEECARLLLSRGIKAMDALHLASAEAARADYLCTCDDRFAKRAKLVGAQATKIVSPLELIAETEP